MRVNIGDKLVFSKIFNQLTKYDISSIKFNGISIDSRKIEKGDIFIALKGFQSDGHDFIDSCLNKGASFIINEKHNNQNMIKVKSSKAIIKDMAIEYRKNMKCKVIAITGSNGKTTTKEMLYHILSSNYTISYTKDNFNSTIGMPISIFSISNLDDIFLAEIGTNQKGEIAYLCEVAKPDFGIITNIAEAHIENFNSLDEIYKEKLNLFKSVSKDGTVFINMDDDYLSSSIDLLNSKKIKYGFNNKYDYKGTYNNSESNKLSITNFNNSDNLILNIPHLNTNMAKNILCSFALASELGIDITTFNKQINSFNIPNGRGNFIYKNHCTIIDDTYNSNYSSTIAGIKSLNHYDNRKIVVLGDMLELGDKSIEFHIGILHHLVENNIKNVFLYGELMEHLYKEAQNHKTDINIFYFHSQNELIKVINTYIVKDDFIYIKGSRSMKMENIIKGIR